MTEGFDLDCLRRQVADFHRGDTATGIYIGYLEHYLRRCKERLRGIRNLLNEEGNERFRERAEGIFIVEGGIQEMIDKLKELVPDGSKRKEGE